MLGLGDNLNSNDEVPKYSGKICVSVSDMVVNNDTTALYRWLIEPRNNNLLPRDMQGWIALYVAASRDDRKECLELLIKHGGNIFRDDDPSTLVERQNALYIACENDREGNVLLLLQEGFNANKMYNGMSPLHITVQRGCGCNIVTHLLHYGANVNDTNPRGMTALHLAAKRRNTEIGRILLENGADVQIKDGKGNLSTHLAVKNHNIDFLRLIIDKKPSIINAENFKRFTALQLAIRFVDVECALYLLDRGAKVKFEMIESVGRLSTDTCGVELVKRLLKHIEVDDSEVVRKYLDSRKSVTCNIINLESVECLSLLLESGLPKYLLQAPLFYMCNGFICTPLVYVLNSLCLSDKIAKAMMRLLLDHDIIFMDEYIRERGGICGPLSWFSIENIEEDRFDLFYQILTDKGVTVDYPLHCISSITNLRINDVNDNLHLFYNPLDFAAPELESFKFYVRNSCILEPSILSVELVSSYIFHSRIPNYLEEFGAAFFSTYSYLIELTPIFYLRHTMKDSSEREYAQNTWELFSPVANEFAKSTLKQFCRMEIRQLLRGNNINDDLFNFQRRVNELPLPICLKNYLLFKD